MTTKDGESLTADEIAIVFSGRFGPMCPDCGFGLVDGPRGGLSVNWHCQMLDCGSRFNFLGPHAELGIDRITDAMPNANPRRRP